ncbi:glycoside hydrolase family 3 C-terminal domain-containing protein [Pontiella sulfatireligans]|uniref:Xylan 1,4-beta-xylosidase n=1 Tax=Pontiella sulfatireligans TaxID=2750658 RepID=A0A6C2UHJ4_9BACT|nr:glycoside hydrolase family 3 C-terminal domain-containing protein [Pontiella sulfatireligans]VGO18967.1 Xylan 1,4-beta-xylosidase [Pontiella sulfatireligans]
MMNRILNKKIAVVATVLMAGGLCAHAGDTILAGENLAEIDANVAKLVEQMTLDEKMVFMHGDPIKLGYDGPPPIERLNIPPYMVAHGPHGARPIYPDPETGRRTVTPGTFMGVSMNYAASWDPELVEKVAHGMGQEIRSMGNHAVAGPAFNIVRDLRCGRSTEYFTEDPFLNARIAVPFVKGLQDEQVIVTLKHLICNNQEWSRGFLDVKVSHRALNEIYFPGFEYAVTEADAMGIMSSYNKINGKWAAENPYVLDTTLRKRWGFKGFVLSDWGGTHSTVDSVKAGLDLEMPRTSWYGKKLKAAVESGEVSMELIDERVSNILRTMYVAKCFDPDFKNPPKSVFKSAPMKALAHELALNSIVLLKNEDGVLPFDKAAVKKVAVIGPHGDYGKHFDEGKYDYTLFQLGGSANVKADQEDMITPLKGIQAYLGDAVEVVYAPGAYAEFGCGPIASKYLTTKEGKPGLSAVYYDGIGFKKEQRSAVDSSISFQWDKDPLIPEAGRRMGSDQKFSVRWEGQLNAPVTREYMMEVRFEGRASLYIDGKKVFTGRDINNRWAQQVKIELTEGPHDIRVEYEKIGRKGIMKLWWDYENIAWTQEAVELAKTSDAVILCVGNSGNMEREGRDRYQGLQLSEAQENLINAVSKVNSKVAAITFTAGVGMEDWIGGVPSVIQAMYPGEQAGKALAEILFGDANPNGKLTVSIPKTVAQYPEGYWGADLKEIEYKEGIFVGYRYFDEHNIEPQFPFGHGLSYTSFEYGEPKVEVKGQTAKVTFDVTNSGKRAGAEVVQLYVHDVECSVPRPKKELKAFKKIALQPGETQSVTLELDDRSFAFFDESTESWVVEPGQFDLLLGSSSRDIRKKAACSIK